MIELMVHWNAALHTKFFPSSSSNREWRSGRTRTLCGERKKQRFSNKLDDAAAVAAADTRNLNVVDIMEIYWMFYLSNHGRWALTENSAGHPKRCKLSLVYFQNLDLTKRVHMQNLEFVLIATRHWFICIAIFSLCQRRSLALSRRILALDLVDAANEQKCFFFWFFFRFTTFFLSSNR